MQSVNERNMSNTKGRALEVYAKKEKDGREQNEYPTRTMRKKSNLGRRRETAVGERSEEGN